MEEHSDDEIFCGKLTLKEIKKMYGVRNNAGSYSENKAFHNIETEPNDSIKIIKTHSQPNLRAVIEEKTTFYSNPGSPALSQDSLDDSFIKLENKVSKLCVAPRTSDNVELNNTLEVIDYILNNGPKIEHATPKRDDSEKLVSIIQENSDIDTDNKKSLTNYTHTEINQQKIPHKDVKNNEQIKVDSKDSEQYFTPIKSEKIIEVATPSSSSLTYYTHIEINQQKIPHKDVKNNEQIKVDSKDSEQYFTPIKSEKIIEVATPSSSSLTYYTHIEINQQKIPYKDVKIRQQNNEQIKVDSKHSKQYFTPIKNEKKIEIATPSSRSVKLKPHVFKTPASLSNKNTFTSAKKTPNRTNAYQHIASPIASYIKNCPQVPLVKDVHPKKPLPSGSSIPKFVKSLPVKSQNKENIDLPKIAYKNAKKTVLINVDQEKLPQSQWAKTTLPRPKVVKHEKRELNPLKALVKQEESFANLSCLQAEVSVCTQKTAFKPNK